MLLVQLKKWKKAKTGKMRFTLLQLFMQNTFIVKKFFLPMTQATALITSHYYHF